VKGWQEYFTLFFFFLSDCFAFPHQRFLFSLLLSSALPVQEVERGIRFTEVTSL